MSDPMNEAKKYFEDLVEKYFGDFGDPIDWAEILSRRVVSISLDNQGFLAGTRWTQEEQLAFMLATQLAVELRGLKSQARDAETVHVKGKVDDARKKLREQFAAPDFLADFIRDAAGMLDSKGMAGEANALRDAATILDTEF